MTEIIDYILRFLLATNISDDLLARIAYNPNEKDIDRYKIVILSSGFFEDMTLLPKLPLEEWERTPILFGKPVIEQKAGTVILHADLIASAFFLLTRHEETLRTNCKDQHGRFIGKESLPYRAGFIHRPIIDEYGFLLRKLLRGNGVSIAEPPQTFNRIYLTHDVDYLAHYRKLKPVIGTLKHQKNTGIALKTYFGSIYNDPWFTFPWLFEQNKKIENLFGEKVKSIAFVKPAGGNQPEDKPISNTFGKDFQTFFRLCKENQVKIGLHPSYEAGENPSLIAKEKKILENASKERITSSRHHFLRALKCDMEPLIECGISDDFTLAYADVAGFRLGTSRAVQWIDTQKKRVTPLLLHPLTIMECSLNDERYMNLPPEAAYDYSIRLIEQVREHNGDLVLLWHNTAVEKNGLSYQRELYEKLIDYLSN